MFSFFIFLTHVFADEIITGYHTETITIETGGNYTFVDCLFATNTESAIQIFYSSAESILFNCFYTSFININTVGGGAFSIFDSNCEINIHYVCIDNCTGYSQGGAFYQRSFIENYLEFYYMTIKNCHAYERVIYTDGDLASNMTYCNCNFTQCSSFNYIENSPGIFLFCDFNTFVKYSTFDCNTAHNSVISYEQYEPETITGVTEKCNIVNNNCTISSLILITRQHYVIENSIIKYNYGSENIFELTNSGTLTLSNCILQEFTTSSFTISNCIIGSAANQYTTYVLNFYQTLGCHADIPYDKTRRIKTNNKKPVKFIRFMRC